MLEVHKIHKFDVVCPCFCILLFIILKVKTCSAEHQVLTLFNLFVKAANSCFSFTLFTLMSDFSVEEISILIAMNVVEQPYMGLKFEGHSSCQRYHI